MSSYPLTEEICPLITTEVLNKLNEIKIKSVKDILTLDLSKVRSISRTKEIDFKQLLEIKNQLYHKFGANKLNTSKIVSKDSGFKTGIDKLDEMLVNGIRRREVTELYGYTDSGKTQFCYTFAAHIIDKYKQKVVFIDTELAFSPIRFQKILQIGKNVSDDRFERVLSRMKILTILDIPSLLDSIDRISYDLKNNSESEYKHLGLVVIDCLSTPLGMALKKNAFEVEIEDERNNSSKASEKRFRCISLVTQLAKTLNSLATEHSLSVIVVNTQSLTMRNNWKNYCKLSLNFFSDENYVNSESESPNKSYNPIRGIKVVRSYDKSIENKSYTDFKISVRGFHI